MTEVVPRHAPRTASVMNLGCKVSFADAERAARDLAARGVRLVADGAADLVVINTCTVTAEADRKSRQAVRRARRQSPDAEILVTGCSAHIAPDVFAALDPALRLVDGRSTDALARELASLFGPTTAGRALPTLSGVEAADAVVPAAPLESAADDRARSERTRAFVKVQDGCSFHCTYCVIPRARGAERSLTPDRVLEDVRAAVASGRREVVLTGINIGTYDGGASEPGPRGSHRWEALSLAGLIRRILDETPVERLRLSSIEPQHVTDELLGVWTDHPDRCLPHFHLPLQSGDDGVLRRMGRRYDSAFYAGLVERIRGAIPGVAIHADVIVGFPTEDDDGWRRSLAFIERLEFAGLHVFRYSERPGTPALRMAGQVPDQVRRERSAALLAHAEACRAAFSARQLWTATRVLFEQPTDDGRWLGHGENHVLVEARAPDGASLDNVIADVSITGRATSAGDRVAGEILAIVPRPEVAVNA